MGRVAILTILILSIQEHWDIFPTQPWFVFWHWHIKMVKKANTIWALLWKLDLTSHTSWKGLRQYWGSMGHIWECQLSMLWPLPLFQPPPPSLASAGLPQGQTRIQGQVVSLWGSTGWGVGVWYEDEKKSSAWCVHKHITPADDRGLVTLGTFRRWSLACFRVTHLRDDGAGAFILQLLSPPVSRTSHPLCIAQDEHARETHMLQKLAAETCCRKPGHALVQWMPRSMEGPPIAPGTFTGVVPPHQASSVLTQSLPSFWCSTLCLASTHSFLRSPHWFTSREDFPDPHRSQPKSLSAHRAFLLRELCPPQSNHTFLLWFIHWLPSH